MSTEGIVFIAGIVGAIVAGMFSRIAGAIAGLLLVGGIMGWGAHVYSAGRSLSFFGNAISETAFWGAAGALGAYEVLSLVLRNAIGRPPAISTPRLTASTSVATLP